MDSQFLDSPYLEEMFLFESEENTTSEDEFQVNEEAMMDGFSSSEDSESDDDELEDSRNVSICIENTRLKRAKFEGDLAAKVLECVTDKVDREMKASAFLFTSPSVEFSEAHLLDMDFEKKLKPKNDCRMFKRVD